AGLTDPRHRVAGFTLTLTAAGSGITDAFGNALTSDASTSFTVYDPGLTLQGRTLTIHGTAGNDSYTFQAGPQYTAARTGLDYPIAPAAVDTVQFQGGGQGLARLFAAGTGNPASLRLGRGELHGSGYTATASGVTDLRIFGGSTDTAALTDD